MADPVAARPLVVDGVALSEIFDGDGAIRHGWLGVSSLVQSNNVGKRLLGFSEIPKAGCQEESHFDCSDREGWPVDAALPSEEAPAKTVYDSHHGIERVEQAKPNWNDTALETDWGNIEAKLDEKRDNKTEVAVFDHKGADPQPDSERGTENKHQEAGQKKYRRGRRITVPNHKGNHEESRDYEIHKASNYAAHDNDEARKIYF
jgi:hypothetical protein